MRRIWRGQRRTVVVDFSRGSIKMAAAETAREAARFRGITLIPLPREEPDQAQLGSSEIALQIGEQVKRNGWVGMPCACLLSGSATSTQSFPFPPMSDAELRQAIELKLSQTLHFDLEEACFGFRRIQERSGGGDRQVLTLVAAARKDEIRGALSVLRQAGLKPVAVGSASESLANLAYYAGLCDEEEVTIHVDIGSDSTILNMFEGRLLRFSREIDTAGDAFTRALMRPIITARGAVGLTHEQAEEVKLAAGYPQEDQDVDLPHDVKASEILAVMEPVAQRLTSEIRRSIDYLCGILGRPNIDRIVLSGPAAQMRNLDAFLEEQLDTAVACIDPVARAMFHWRLAVCDENPPSLAGFSAILGYSLGNNRPINLLPREEKLKEVVHHVSRIRKASTPCVLSLALCLALASVPINQTYGEATALMQWTSNQLDERLAAAADIARRLESTTRTAQRVATARGPVPDWLGIMKELSAILPEQTHITSLSTEREEGARMIHLVARVHEGPVPFELVITQLTVSLGTSPFFRRVQVVDASMADEWQEGRFEAKLEIVARCAEPRVSKS